MHSWLPYPILTPPMPHRHLPKFVQPKPSAHCYNPKPPPPHLQIKFCFYFYLILNLHSGWYVYTVSRRNLWHMFLSQFELSNQLFFLLVIRITINSPTRHLNYILTKQLLLIVLHLAGSVSNLCNLTATP